MTQLKLRRSDRLWFPRGDVIIRVPGGSLEFRVHGERLAAISAPLADCLRHTVETFEGCPVMYLVQGPTDTEAVHFLSAILILEYFDTVLNHEITFDAIAAVYKLSGTYKIPCLRRKSFMLLSDAYPCTLVDLAAGRRIPTLAHARKQIVAVIHFARIAQLHWILPYAYYRYCYELGGGMCIPVHKQLELCGDPMFFDKAAAKMDAANRKLIDGFSWRLIALEPVGCTGGDRCYRSRLDEWTWLWSRSRSAKDVFRSWAPEPGSALCAACLAYTVEWYDERMEAFWERLPRMFGLPAWSVLIAKREKFLREL